MCGAWVCVCVVCRMYDVWCVHVEMCVWCVCGMCDFVCDVIVHVGFVVCMYVRCMCLMCVGCVYTRCLLCLVWCGVFVCMCFVCGSCVYGVCAFWACECVWCMFVYYQSDRNKSQSNGQVTGLAS